MVNRQFATNIRNLLKDSEGFFIGNSSNLDKRDKNKLQSIFEAKGLFCVVMQDPIIKGNEYWIVGKIEQPHLARTFSRVLRKNLMAHSNRQQILTRYSNNYPELAT